MQKIKTQRYNYYFSGKKYLTHTQNMENKRDSSTERMRKEVERQQQERKDQSIASNMQQMEIDEMDMGGDHPMGGGMKMQKGLPNFFYDNEIKDVLDDAVFMD